MARSVFAADVDGDGDMDVLSASVRTTVNKIAWYENLDGNWKCFGPHRRARSRCMRGDVRSLLRH